MSKWEPTTRPWIVCAAISFDGLIITGARHHDKVMNDVIARLGGHNEVYEACEGRPVQGFIDQFGRFYTREEAFLIAESNGQLVKVPKHRQYSRGKQLFSEDLY